MIQETQNLTLDDPKLTPDLRKRIAETRDLTEKVSEDKSLKNSISHFLTMCTRVSIAQPFLQFRN